MEARRYQEARGGKEFVSGTPFAYEQHSAHGLSDRMMPAQSRNSDLIKRFTPSLLSGAARTCRLLAPTGVEIKKRAAYAFHCGPVRCCLKVDASDGSSNSNPSANSRERCIIGCKVFANSSCLRLCSEVRASRLQANGLSCLRVCRSIGLLSDGLTLGKRQKRPRPQLPQRR